MLSHLRWILDLIATLRKSATANNSMTTTLASLQDKHRQNSFPIRALWHLNLLQCLHHKLILSMHFLCAAICRQESATE